MARIRTNDHLDHGSPRARAGCCSTFGQHAGMPLAVGPSGSLPVWFQAHRIIQSTGLIVSIIAFIIALSMVPKGSHFTKLHHKLGLAVMILGILQPMNALIRPHPPKGNAPATGTPSLARKVRMRVFMGSRG
jgi:hypothetical protein